MTDVPKFGLNFGCFYVKVVLCFFFADSAGYCARCKKPVIGVETGCLALDEVYHLGCFTCSKCRKWFSPSLSLSLSFSPLPSPSLSLPSLIHFHMQVCKHKAIPCEDHSLPLYTVAYTLTARITTYAILTFPRNVDKNIRKYFSLLSRFPYTSSQWPVCLHSYKC